VNICIFHGYLEEIEQGEALIFLSSFLSVLASPPHVHYIVAKVDEFTLYKFDIFDYFFN
jgi:hypothetical protein